MSTSRDFHEGYSLASTVVMNMPREMQLPEWQDAIALLKELCTSQTSDEPIWDWFKKYRPDDMSKVAPEGRLDFAAGVRAAYLDHELDL